MAFSASGSSRVLHIVPKFPSRITLLSRTHADVSSIPSQPHGYGISGLPSVWSFIVSINLTPKASCDAVSSCTSVVSWCLSRRCWNNIDRVYLTPSEMGSDCL